MRKIRTIATNIAITAAAVMAIDGPALAADAISVSGATTVTATVEAVDQASRVVTLRDAKGKKITFVAGDEVKNLAQVAAGDTVTMEYAEAVAVKLDKSMSAIRERSVSEASERAAAGLKPGVTTMREVKIVASVEAIDLKNSTVTLRGPENTVVLKVRDAATLAGLKAGDFVDAVYRETLAIRVEAGKK